MKKYCASLIFCCLIVISAFSFAYAEGGITEGSNVKIFIDANPQKFNDVPIVVNNRLLLPLRAVLTSLGVQNDDSHIIWNGQESSVKIKKDSMTVYLKVGSTSVSVNGKQTELDASPVNYKNRVYIPVRFVAQSLGKKVAWDSQTASVFIRDEAEYNRIKDILAKSDNVMKALKRDIYIDDYSLILSSGSRKMGHKSKMTVKLDRENKVQYQSLDIVDSLNKTSKNEMYIKDGIMYQKLSDDLGWNKKKLNENDLASAFMYKGYDEDDVICCALTEDKGTSDEIVLKGSVCRDMEYKQGLYNAGISNYNIGESYMELHINKQSYQLVKAYSEYVGNVPSMDGSPDFLFMSAEESTAPNGNFKVEEPSNF